MQASDNDSTKPAITKAQTAKSARHVSWYSWSNTSTVYQRAQSGAKQSTAIQGKRSNTHLYWRGPMLSSLAEAVHVRLGAALPLPLARAANMLSAMDCTSGGTYSQHGHNGGGKTSSVETICANSVGHTTGESIDSSVSNHWKYSSTFCPHADQSYIRLLPLLSIQQMYE